MTERTERSGAAVAAVRVEAPGDVESVRAVLVAAFDGEAEAGLVETLRDSDAWLPDLSVVAVQDQSIIGYALLSRIVIAGDEDVPALALGPVAVLPEAQRRGIGTAMIRDTLARAPDERLVVVLGDPAFYRRFGFVAASALGITGAWMSFGDPWQALPRGEPVAGEALYPDAWDDL